MIGCENFGRDLLLNYLICHSEGSEESFVISDGIVINDIPDSFD